MMMMTILCSRIYNSVCAEYLALQMTPPRKQNLSQFSMASKGNILRIETFPVLNVKKHAKAKENQISISWILTALLFAVSVTKNATLSLLCICKSMNMVTNQLLKNVMTVKNPSHLLAS